MPKRNRKTLKNYFVQGSLPTEANFGDLVDSTLNMMDDGFSRSPANGVEITLLGDQHRLVSFFSDPQVESPDWAITCESGDSSLNFVSSRPSPSGAEAANRQAPAGSIAPGPADAPEAEILTLTKEGNVGVRVSQPAYRLDVDGAVRSTGRFGRSDSVPADGEWHPVTGELDGCHALEVMAGVGLEGEKKGRYALLHAFALNTFNPRGFLFNFLNLKKKIRCSRAWYLSRGDRLKLRWRAVEGTPHKYKLELKSMTGYGDGIYIQFSITELWFDPDMRHSKDSPKRA